MFVLESAWQLAAPAQRVWSVLADPDFTWPEWWPGLTASATRAVAGVDGLAAAGTWANLRVRSPLGYALRFRLCLAQTTAPSDDAPGRALLNVSGDLTGQAEVTVSALAVPGAAGAGPFDVGRFDVGTRTDVRLVWRVSPVPVWFRAAARLGPGPLTWAHAHVMRAGERGLAEHLRP